MAAAGSIDAVERLGSKTRHLRGNDRPPQRMKRCGVVPTRSASTLDANAQHSGVRAGVPAALDRPPAAR
jgi:hypothetical protein